MKKSATKLINPTANQKGSSHGGAVSITAAPSAATSRQQQLAATMPPPHTIQLSSQQQGTNDGALVLPRRSQAQIFAAQQQELSRQFGVVCAETITWKLWNVGGEYERRLIIKNTHDKLQVISYKLPKHKAVFFVDFPEPVSLSSGMSHSLSIRFRPSELVECNDEMEICVRGRGSFFVHLQALTPYAHLTTPDKYDFELCPVNVPTSYTFPVKNSGTVPLSVTWEVPEPFSIEPKRIALEEGEQTNVTVTFLPRDAKPVIAQAVCRIDESGDVIAFVRFSGISRFGFLQAKEDGVLVGGGGTNTTKKAITSANSNTTRGATMMANNAAIPMQCSGTGRDITIDFGPMLTTTRTTRYITIVNPSDVDADFQIKRLDKDITSAFFISPLAATVPRRGGEVRVSIRFEPKNTGAHYSSSYILDSICCSSLIKFQCSGEAIGPTVSLSATSIDFGDVDVDAICGDDLIRAANPLAAQTPITIEKHVSLRNTSSVPLKFEFAGAIPGGAFVVSPPNGSINAKTSMNIKITFAPDAPVNYLRRMYLLTSFGDSALILDVFGTAFTAKTRPAPFNARGVQLYFLKAERGLGSLPPDELERLVGMLREGVDPTNEKDESAMEALADVLSSASPVTSPRLVSSETPRYTTGTTSKSHTSKAAKKRAQLSTVFPGDRSQSIYPFVLDTPLVTIRHETLRDPQVVVVRNTTSSKATASWSLPVESRVHAYSILQAAKDSSTANHSKSGKKSGASSPLGSPRGGPSTANTAGQLNPANMDSFWRITPTTADIPPHGTATFQVSLDPNAPPASFGCFLECFVTYKTMRSFRLVTDDSFVPSQCLLLQCTHLAPFRENGPTPHVQLPTAVAFPPCEEKKAVYQVVDLHNNGNTAQAYDIHIEATMLRDTTGGSPNALYPDMASASMYKSINYDNDVSGGGGGGIDDDSRQMTLDDIALSEERKKMLSGVFTSYPSSGIIPPGGSALVLVKFSPPLRSQFLGAAHIAFNGSNVPSSNIVLKGESFVPSVSLQSGSRLTFRPTTIGATCTREYVITNRSRIAVDYEIAVPEEFAGIFHVSSTHGTIQGCQELRLQASFTPQAEMKYQTSIPVHITSAGDFVTAAAPTSLKITALGAGEVGLLSMEPLSVKVPSVSVGSFVQRTLTIFNTGLSDTAFQLRCISKRASQQSQPGGADLGALQLTNNGNTSGLNEDQQDAVVMMPEVQFGPSSSGIVRARAHLNVSVRIKLPTRGTFQLSIYALSHGSLELLESAPTPTQQEMRRLPMSVFTMTGEHPTLQVADVRCIHQQKSQLWTQMNVGSFNAKLREPVDEVDRRIRPMLFDDAINELSGIECHLGTDIFHAAPLRILIALKNDGNSSVKYDFRLPLDNEIAKEPWHADKRGLDDPIADVVDKGLFDIQPRCGLIPPFGQAVVTLQYCHSEIGTHAIPAILRVNDGKQVLMNMTATTNSPAAKMLTFHHAMRHELQPVAIGDLDPPLQYTEVQNLSSVPINFTIDEQAFTHLKEANYDFPILQCLNHSGSIPPMSTLLLSWYFRPLEAKQYEVPLTVTVEGGDSYSITLIGSGYHPKLLSKDALITMNTTGFSDIPAVPSLEHLTLPMRLSMDVIRYGTIAFHTLHRRHVQLSNTHPTDTFLFEWHCVLQHGDQVFEVEPPSGQLLPGETIHFRVSLYAGSTSHILDTAVHCHVINESLRLRRQAITAKKEHAAALNLNNKHQQMSSDLLGLTGGSGAGGATGGAKVPRGSRPRMPITTVPPKYQSMKRLQRTVQALEDAAIAEDMDEGADEWAHVPVVPTVVELIVQARIMPIDAYTDLFGEEAAASMFYPTLLGTKYPGDIFPVSSLGPVRTPTPLVGNSTANERQVAEGCLKEMLKRVVQHVSVQEALLDPREDPVPYFCEAIATSIMGDDKDVEQMRAESALCDMVIDERDAPTSTGLPPRQPPKSSLSEEEEELRRKSATMASNNTHPIDGLVNGSDEDEGVDDAVVFSRVTKRAVEPVPGDIQCIVEEVLEDVLFGLVASALAAEGVVVSAAEERKRAQSLRRDTLY